MLIVIFSLLNCQTPESENIAKQTSLTHVQISKDGKGEVLMNNDYTHWKHLEEK
ncbi:hypothetical protein [Filifactor villosus]|uniref:Uncharacterized protein n=1 Tax=Filifactor villosus TaxID=29374 RepID=A0ABV9QJ35_9FIRM